MELLDLLLPFFLLSLALLAAIVLSGIRAAKRRQSMARRPTGLTISWESVGILTGDVEGAKTIPNGQRYLDYGQVIEKKAGGRYYPLTGD
jgi:hypothetical protein